MRVLHYIHTLDSDNTYSSVFLSQLSSLQSETIEVHLALRGIRSGNSPKGVIVHQINSRREFLKTLYDVMPDIVHVHCAWTPQVTKVVKSASSRGFIVFISANGEPHPIRRFFTLKRAERVIVSNEDEKKSIMLRIANKRISVVRESLTDKSVDSRKMAEDIIAQYQKSLDKYVERLINVSTWQAFYTLIKTAVTDENKPLRPAGKSVSEAAIQNFSLLSAQDWRKMHIFATKNQLEPLIAHGIEVLGVDTKGVSFSQNTQTDQESKSAGDIIDILRQMKKKDRKGILSIADMTMLYQALRQKDFDESEFEKSVKHTHLRNFVIKMEKKLDETFGLEEGFMPIPTASKKDQLTYNKETYED